MCVLLVRMVVQLSLTIRQYGADAPLTKSQQLAEVSRMATALEMALAVGPTVALTDERTNALTGYLQLGAAGGANLRAGGSPLRSRGQHWAHSSRCHHSLVSLLPRLHRHLR